MNRINYISLLLCLLILGISQQVNGQDFKADVKKMHASYNDTDYFYAEVAVNAYGHSSEHVPLLTRNAVIRKKGNKFHYSLEGKTMLFNDRYAIMVSNRDKIILYEEVEQGEDVSVADLVTPDLDSLLVGYTDVQFIGLEAGLKHYRIEKKDSGINKVDLFLNEKSLLLSKVIYWYNSTLFEHEKMAVIEFNNISISDDFNASVFSEDQFVVQENGKLKPASDYSDYQVLNTNNVND